MSESHKVDDTENNKKVGVEASANLSVQQLIGEAIMAPRKDGFLCQDKRIPNSTKQFYGIIRVPEEGYINFFDKIVKIFNNSQPNITGLPKMTDVKGAFDDLNDGINDKSIPEKGIPSECLRKIQAREMFSLAEAKSLLKQEGAASGEKLQNKPDENTKKKTEEKSKIKKGPLENVNVSQLDTGANVVVGTGEASSSPKNKPTPVLAEKKAEVERNAGGMKTVFKEETLVWCFQDEDGNFGRTYTFDKEAEQKIIEAADSNVSPEKFYLECGMRMIPILHKENAVLRQQAGSLERNLAKTKTLLQEANDELAKRARLEFNAGNQEISIVSQTTMELNKAKTEKEAAETMVAALQCTVKSLNDKLSQQGNGGLEEVVTRLKSLELSVKKTEETAAAANLNTEKIVNILGEKKNRWNTPAGEKLATLDSKIILFSKNTFFRAVKSYKILGKDIDRMEKENNLVKITVEGSGMHMASEIHKFNSDGGWGNDAMMVIIIDDAEIGVKSNLAIVANILQMTLTANKVANALIVAGPTSNTETEENRKEILEKIGEMSTMTVINMTETARRLGSEMINKFESEGNWTPLGAAYFMSMVAWWVESIKVEPDKRTDPIICNMCGFVHNEDSCKKDELPSKSASAVGKVDEPGSSQEGKYVNNRPSCPNCPRKHYGECWGLNPPFPRSNTAVPRSNTAAPRNNTTAHKRKRQDGSGPFSQ